MSAEHGPSINHEKTTPPETPAMQIDRAAEIRVLSGHLDPDEKIVGAIKKTDLEPDLKTGKDFSKETDLKIAKASIAKRSTIKDYEYSGWADSIKKDYFEHFKTEGPGKHKTPESEHRVEFFKHFGINVNKIEDDKLKDFYDQYFSEGKEKEGAHNFIKKVNEFYKKDPHMLETIQKDKELIKSFASAFSEECGIVISAKIQGLSKLKDNEASKTLTLDAVKLKSSRVNNIPKDDPIYKAFKYVATYGEGAEAPSIRTQIDSNDLESQNTQIEIGHASGRIVSILQGFETRYTVPQNINTNSEEVKRFLVPSLTKDTKLSFTPQELEELKQPDIPLYISQEALNRNYPNALIAPYYNLITEPRFKTIVDNFTDYTNLLAYISISSTNIETQGRVGELLYQTVLKVHERSPELFEQWLRTQGDFSQVLLANLQSTQRGLQDNAKRLVLFSSPNQIDTEGTLQLWKSRIRNIREALDTGSITEDQFRQLGFLAASVDLEKVITKIQYADADARTAAPVEPDPTPPPEPRPQAMTGRDPHDINGAVTSAAEGSARGNAPKGDTVADASDGRTTIDNQDSADSEGSESGGFDGGGPSDGALDGGD